MLCDTCTYYEYDEDDDEYYCSCYLDEDDMERILSSRYKLCPFYRNGDEYALVRHQM